MVLEGENIKKIYGKGQIKTQALAGVTFSIKDKEFVTIMGASGSGKTSLLNCISTIDMPSGGTVKLNGKNITLLSETERAIIRREHLGFVFQDSRLLDTLTVEENIMLPLTIKEIDPKEIIEKVRNISRFLDINNTLKKFPYEISGGQKQRVAIARAIVSEPKILMADEPTGALDSHMTKKVMELLCEINQTMQMAILLVTHDAIAASYSDKILILKDGNINKELIKGKRTRSEFYHEILNVLSSEG